MKVLIIEDEEVAVRNLKRLLTDIDPKIEIIEVIPSISQAVEWFLNPKPVDLIFLDIQLSDGVSFEIFMHANVETPIIFTTAFDEYALKAFELNSVDYLLKPINPKKLEKAVEKYKNLYTSNKSTINFQELFNNYQQANSYKTRFLVKSGQKLISLNIGDIAYFIKDEIIVLVTIDNHHYPINFTLDELETQVNPDDFFRLNRQVLASRKSLEKIHSYFKGKVKIELNPPVNLEVIVSQEKGNSFKNWLGA